MTNLEKVLIKHILRKYCLSENYELIDHSHRETCRTCRFAEFDNCDEAFAKWLMQEGEEDD